VPLVRSAADAGIGWTSDMIYDGDIISHGATGMRTLVDLGDHQVQALDELAKTEKRSRAALIRQAIDAFLVDRRGKLNDDAFGLWGKRPTDGLAYQEKLRGEW
jgi:hypothetical protein